MMICCYNDFTADSSKKKWRKYFIVKFAGLLILQNKFTIEKYFFSPHNDVQGTREIVFSVVVLLPSSAKA